MSSTLESKIEMLREQTNQQDAVNNSVSVVEPVNTPEACIRVLLMGDQPIVRRGIRLVIEQQSRFTVVGEITNSEQELASFSEPYGIVVTDIASDIQGSLMHLGRIIKTAGDAGVIVLMQSSHPGLRLAVARLGALGLVSKEHHIESLLNAIVAVHIGEVWFDRELIREVKLREHPEVPQRQTGDAHGRPASAARLVDGGPDQVVAQGQEPRRVPPQFPHCRRLPVARPRRLLPEAKRRNPESPV